MDCACYLILIVNGGEAEIRVFLQPLDPTAIAKNQPPDEIIKNRNNHDEPPTYIFPE